jgi:CHASE3 domain sensor protein
MTDRLKREPWLILKKASGTQDLVLLDESARNLARASANMADTVENLRTIVTDPEAAARLQAGRAQDLIDQIRAVYKELEGRREQLEKKLKEVDRKSGGKLLERARESDTPK